MSELSKLAGKEIKVDVGGVKIVIKPLTTSDMNLIHKFKEGESEEQQIEKTKKLVLAAVPGSTIEELDNMTVGHLDDLLEVIMKASNLDSEKIDRRAKALNDIKKRQSGK